MIKDAVKETARFFGLQDTLSSLSEEGDEPEVTKVLVGVFFVLFAQILYVSVCVL